MRAIGLYLDGHTLRTAQVKKAMSGSFAFDTKSLNLSVEHPNVKPLYMTRTTSGLPSREVLFRGAEIPSIRHQELVQALSHHAESTHHLNPDEVLSIPWIRGRNQILYALTTRTALKEHLEDWKKHEIEPDWVVPIPTALSRYWDAKGGPQEGWILDIGFNETTVALRTGGLTVQGHGISIGIGALYESLAIDRRQSLLPTEAIDLDLVNGPFREKLEELVEEIQRALHSMDRSETARPLLLSGHLDAFPSFASFLFRKLGSCVSELRLADQPKHAIAIGLSLENGAFNFRKGPLASRREKSRIRYLLGTLVLSSLAASLLLWGWGTHLIEHRREAIVRAFEAPLPTLLRSDIISDRIPENVLSRWKRDIRDSKKSPPYPLLAPTVQDLLAWWTQHPLLGALAKGGDPITLRSLTYELESYPKVSSIDQKTVVRVHLSFDTENPTSARKFHDALLEDAQVEGPVRWETSGNLYTTSFILKRHVH